MSGFVLTSRDNLASCKTARSVDDGPQQVAVASWPTAAFRNRCASSSMFPWKYRVRAFFEPLAVTNSSSNEQQTTTTACGVTADIVQCQNVRPGSRLFCHWPSVARTRRRVPNAAIQVGTQVGQWAGGWVGSVESAARCARRRVPTTCRRRCRGIVRIIPP